VLPSTKAGMHLAHWTARLAGTRRSYLRFKQVAGLSGLVSVPHGNFSATFTQPPIMCGTSPLRHMYGIATQV
jgi:hypothetical protein